MKILRATVVALGLTLLTGAVAEAQNTNYAPWQGRIQNGDMPELLSTLRTMTDQAERSKAANPAFLADLRRVVSDYDIRYRWPVTVMFDDFRDGEFAHNPAWNVVNGNWQVTNRGGVNALWSNAHRDNGNYNQSNSNDVVTNVLGALLSQQNGQNQNNNNQNQGNDQYQANGQNQGNGEYQNNGNGQYQGRDSSASIVAPVAIPDQFYIRLDLAARRGGQFSFGPYAGKRAQDSYQVTYTAGGQGQGGGLVLSRVSDRGSQVLGSSRGPINLDDNQSHVIEWMRGPAGKMTVTLDGRPVLDATDAGLRRPFGGFLMINSEGSFGVRSVTINAARL